MPIRDTYCSFCGAAYAPPLAYPRTCGSCAITVWSNPIPVSVVLVPVRREGRLGLLVVRRAIEPRLGKLGIVGGFLEDHETWQEGGAREVREEANVRIDPAALAPFWFASSQPKPNRLLLFSIAPELDAAALPPHAPNAETSERGLVFGPDGLDGELAFASHVEAAKKFFAQRGIAGPHAYARV